MSYLTVASHVHPRRCPNHELPNCGISRTVASHVHPRRYPHNELPNCGIYNVHPRRCPNHDLPNCGIMFTLEGSQTMRCQTVVYDVYPRRCLKHEQGCQWEVRRTILCGRPMCMYHTSNPPKQPRHNPQRS